jgi:hypothetical protein
MGPYGSSVPAPVRENPPLASPLPTPTIEMVTGTGVGVVVVCADALAMRMAKIIGRTKVITESSLRMVGEENSQTPSGKPWKSLDLGSGAGDVRKIRWNCRDRG